MVRLAALAGALALAPGCSVGHMFVGESETESATTTVEAPGSIRAGRHFGYIRAIDGTTIEFDQAEFLVGEEANAAARADGSIGSGETVPNDYYIRNADTGTVRLAVAQTVRVTIVQCPTSCREGVQGTFVGLTRSFIAPKANTTYADRYRGPNSQYWVTLRSGRVVAVDEQYVP
jgi:hypothetical protein